MNFFHRSRRVRPELSKGEPRARGATHGGPLEKRHHVSDPSLDDGLPLYDQHTHDNRQPPGLARQEMSPPVHAQPHDRAPLSEDILVAEVISVMPDTMPFGLSWYGNELSGLDGYNNTLAGRALVTCSTGMSMCVAGGRCLALDVVCCPPDGRTFCQAGYSCGSNSCDKCTGTCVPAGYNPSITAYTSADPTPTVASSSSAPTSSSSSVRSSTSSVRSSTSTVASSTSSSTSNKPSSTSSSTSSTSSTSLSISKVVKTKTVTPSPSASQTSAPVAASGPSNTIIVGAVVGGVVMVVLIVGIMYYCSRRRKKNEMRESIRLADSPSISPFPHRRGGSQHQLDAYGHRRDDPADTPMALVAYGDRYELEPLEEPNRGAPALYGVSTPRQSAHDYTEYHGPQPQGYGGAMGMDPYADTSRSNSYHDPNARFDPRMGQQGYVNEYGGGYPGPGVAGAGFQQHAQQYRNASPSHDSYGYHNSPHSGFNQHTGSDNGYPIGSRQTSYASAMSGVPSQYPAQSMSRHVPRLSDGTDSSHPLVAHAAHPGMSPPPIVPSSAYGGIVQHQDGGPIRDPSMPFVPPMVGKTTYGRDLSPGVVLAPLASNEPPLSGGSSGSHSGPMTKWDEAGYKLTSPPASPAVGLQPPNLTDVAPKRTSTGPRRKAVPSDLVLEPNAPAASRQSSPRQPPPKQPPPPTPSNRSTSPTPTMLSAALTNAQGRAASTTPMVTAASSRRESATTQQSFNTAPSPASTPSSVVAHALPPQGSPPAGPLPPAPRPLPAAPSSVSSAPKPLQPVTAHSSVQSLSSVNTVSTGSIVASRPASRAPALSLFFGSDLDSPLFDGSFASPGGTSPLRTRPKTGEVSASGSAIALTMPPPSPKPSTPSAGDTTPKPPTPMPVENSKEGATPAKRESNTFGGEEASSPAPPPPEYDPRWNSVYGGV